ncbi:LemA family protein [Patescibacteria group bacterium]
MSKGAIIAIIVVVAIALIVFAWIVGVRNSMVTRQADVENGWAQVENQYQQRLDLIGNLVEAVKGAAKQELTVFTEVTKLRSQWADAVNSGNRDQEMDTANAIDGVVSKLLLVAEDYPELKSNENFLRLQDQLEGMEHRIATERMRYNDSVTVYNKYIRVWPNSAFAVWFNFSDEELFEAEEGAEDAPQVEFDIQPISE